MNLGSKEQIVFWKNMKDHEFSAHSAARATIRLAKKFIGLNVLDVGAGDGTLAKELRKNYNCFCTSIDIAPADPSVVQGDITDLNYLGSTFDTVFCLDVLEHLTFDQAEKAVSEIRRVLKRDGFFIITGPYKEVLASNILTCPFCQNEFHKSGHQQMIDFPCLKNLLKGFSIVKGKICNLGFMQLFGFPAELFYRWRLHKIFKHKLLTKNFFVVARKL